MSTPILVLVIEERKYEDESYMVPVAAIYRAMDGNLAMEAATAFTDGSYIVNGHNLVPLDKDFNGSGEFAASLLVALRQNYERCTHLHPVLDYADVDGLIDTETLEAETITLLIYCPMQVDGERLPITHSVY